MLAEMNYIRSFVGNTPIRRLKFSGIDLYIKLEYNNYSGSLKDRAAYNIMFEAVKRGHVNQDSVIVESSSGNFAVALAFICKNLQLDFIPVIDPNINKTYENLLRRLCRKVVKVSEQDSTGGYLLTRIEMVKSICKANKNAFWPNQYENKDNYRGYYQLGEEIQRSLPQLDYVFIAVSSTGTITGLSRKLKSIYPDIKVIAVDVEGSVVFGGPAKGRVMSGIGASQTSPNLLDAHIDEVIHVRQEHIVDGCHELCEEQMVFAGASTGAVYYAIKSYFSDRSAVDNPSVLFLCADRGNAYLDTVYNDEWLAAKGLNQVNV